MTDGSILRTARPGNPRMDLRDAGAPKRIAPCTAIADPVPLVLRSVERHVPVSERAEVLDMLGVAS